MTLYDRYLGQVSFEEEMYELNGTFWWKKIVIK